MNMVEQQVAAIDGQAKTDFERCTTHGMQIKYASGMKMLHQTLQKDTTYCRVKTYARDYAKLEIRVNHRAA
eukprot:4430571-Pyramimonas_sp.AAC.1